MKKLIKFFIIFCLFKYGIFYMLLVPSLVVPGILNSNISVIDIVTDNLSENDTIVLEREIKNICDIKADKFITFVEKYLDSEPAIKRMEERIASQNK